MQKKKKKKKKANESPLCAKKNPKTNKPTFLLYNCSSPPSTHALIHCYEPLNFTQIGKLYAPQ